ncbi:hypothetical protein C7N43_13630 [Sphingobacteriales bacterium UPWRP_1]|nr:hypothetical protein BVG80_11600 [Sphingobacteriales bacterium TSM_CSM]PSJ76489.1 hypothetical protein C7N43_13630 [Sphingobacteriales bacterium UPWRP_1]
MLCRNPKINHAKERQEQKQFLFHRNFFYYINASLLANKACNIYFAKVTIVAEFLQHFNAI